MVKSDFSLYDREYFQNIIYESTSVSEVLRKLGLSDYGFNHTKLTNFLKESNYDTHTLVGRKLNRYDSTGIPKKKLSEQLQKNSTRNTNKLKKRLLKEGVKENKCEKCGIVEWMGNEIVFELHHINGDNSDNRLENLILLCPNCHSQTSNFRGKNSSIDLECLEITKQTSESKMLYLLDREKIREEEIYQNKLKWGEIRKTPTKEKTIKYCNYCGKKIVGKGNKYCSNECYNTAQAKNIPTKEELLEESFNHKSLESLSKKYKICGNACKKWLLKYNIYDEIKINFKQKTYPIYQYDLDGNFIKEWKDGDEIVNVLGFNKSKIHNVCRKCQKTSNGYIWKYKKDVENKD